MTCDIVIVSCKRDLTWLYLNLRLLLKHWATPGNIIVRPMKIAGRTSPIGDLGPRVLFRYVQSMAGRLCAFQMYLKCISDDFSAADILVLCDSDLMLLAPSSLEMLMRRRQTDR